MSLVGWLFLLVVLAAVGAYAASRRRPKRPAPTVPHVAGDPDDLGSLGLSEVRPASARSEARPVQARPVEPAARPAASPVGLPAVPSDDAPRPRAASVGGLAVAPGPPWAAPAAAHLLASLAAHTGGVVAVVRADGERYVVEARTDGGALEPVGGPPVALHGPTDLARGTLRTLAALVGGSGRAVPFGDRVVLVGGEGRASGRYLDLLASLVPGGPAPDHVFDLLPDASTAASGADAVEAELAARAGGRPKSAAGRGPSDEAPPVPRAAIIAQEQTAAREAARPLAFALVTLADAEERLTQHAPQDVARAEADLRDRLATAPDVRRIEPFGDLLFGAFLDLDPDGAAVWCDRLASGDPPLFIGAVAPADGDPTGIRDAAAQALRDAYDQRRTRVVEA